MDARTVISAYSQIIQSFCRLSQSTLAYALEFFLASPIVTALALSTSLLQLQVDVQINLVQSSGPWLLVSTLNAIRISANDDQLLNGLGTNALAYIPDSNRSRLASLAIIGYDMETNSSDSICYCLPGNTCLMPGAIYSNAEMSTFGIYRVSDDRIPIQGMKVSCQLLEGILASTLECFYEPSCISLFVSNASTFVPLNPPQSNQLPMNTTMETLFNNLMVEQWFSSVSPSNYYAQCAPFICTYSVTERNSILVIITMIIALIGGLNTVLRFIIPHIVHMIMTNLRKLSMNVPNQVITTAWRENTTRLGKIVTYSIVEKHSNTINRSSKKQNSLSVYDNQEIQFI